MKILIIGSGGQLGADCVEILGQSHRTAAVDYPEIDITDARSVAAACSLHQPETIINCAAYTAVDRCETDAAAAWAVNADGPGLIGKAATDLGARVFHISTDYVFDGNKPVPEPYTEDDPVNPLSGYGRSKLAGERNLLAACPDAVILRTAWLYSAHGPNFLKTMLRMALSDPRRTFTIVADQFGSLTWSYTLARQIEKLLDSSLHGVLHATSDGYSSWFEAACYFLRQMEVEHSFVACTTEDYPTPAKRPANSILRNKVLDDNGLSIFPTWQNDLDAFVAQFRDQLIAETKKLLDKA